MSKGKACTGRDEQSIEMTNQIREKIAKMRRSMDLLQQAREEGQLLDKEIEFLRKTIAEIKLRIQETIKEPTSWSYQGRLVSNNLNKSLEKKDVTVENEEMDYIFIKTDLMFDANSSTEYQKEPLKRRKEDIAALYNDLLQSSSQDTQNLQEWFDKKSKSLEEAGKDHNKKDNISIRNILDDDANKENKIEMQELEAKDNAYSNKNLLIEEDQMIKAKNACDSAEPKTSADLMSRNLDTNTQEKSLENKDDKSLSPSMLDSSKRSSRYNVAIKPATSLKFGEIVYNQTRQSNTNKILRSSLKTKLIEDKSEIINKQKATENVENKLIKEKEKVLNKN
ncbi:tropomyosin-like [Bombus flavifrons]|uniref:tropomyosin-like n=1 Tax=Bombus flavifrons TaxID=103934 RepID=UPI0037041E9C